jgi:5'-3' exonuclease
VGATVGLLNSLLALITKSGATHVACAFDHVIESFRNRLYPGYKTAAGVPAELLAQFPLAEKAVAALGVVVWPMVEFEADDALATATKRYRGKAGVDQVVLCSPDKDLAQLVSGVQVVCWDRRRDIVYDEAAVLEKFGVRPASIPDWLALVGDSADGFPGVPGWGPKSASAVLARYEHLEAGCASAREGPGPGVAWRAGSTEAALSRAGRQSATRARPALVFASSGRLNVRKLIGQALGLVGSPSCSKRLRLLSHLRA